MGVSPNPSCKYKSQFWCINLFTANKQPSISYQFKEILGQSRCPQPSTVAAKSCSKLVYLQSKVSSHPWNNTCWSLRQYNKIEVGGFPKAFVNVDWKARHLEDYFSMLSTTFIIWPNKQAWLIRAKRQSGSRRGDPKRSSPEDVPEMSEKACIPWEANNDELHSPQKMENWHTFDVTISIHSTLS